MWLETAPPELVDAGPVVLRPQHVDDAAAIAAAIRVSREEIRPWLPFANDDEAITEAAQRRRLEDAALGWQSGTDFPYSVLAPEHGALVGLIGLHLRVGPGCMEIGYWIDTRWSGRGLMTAAAGALTGIALGLGGVERVEIHCDEANRRSAAIPRRLGFDLDRIEDYPVDAPGQTGRRLIWIRSR